MSVASVFHALGWIVAVFGVLMLLPGLLALLEGDHRHAWTFTASAGLTGFIGGALISATRGAGSQFGRRESYLFLCLVWLLLSLLGAVPLHFGGITENVVEAVFESTSGLTTTGATILQGLDLVPRAVLLWRALLQGFGGLLTVIMAAAVLTGLGVGAMDLVPSPIPRGEASGLLRRMARVSRELAGLYVLLLLICAVLLWLAGMAPFEAACHALSTLSTGGFSTRDGGIAEFSGWGVQPVLVVFMLLGACNFSLHWALAQGRFRAWHRHPEARYLVVASMAAVAAVALLAVLRDPANAGAAAAYGAFAAVSALTTTGYAGDGVPERLLAPSLMISLLLIGGAAGSTAGGLKLLRLAVMVKQALRELRRLTHMHAVVRVRVGDQVVDDAHIWAVWSFFFAFLVTFAGTAVGLAAFGLAPVSALAAAVAALANAGPAIAMIDPWAPAYVAMSEAAQLWLSLAMIIGRLELVTFFVLLNRSYWRN